MEDIGGLFGLIIVLGLIIFGIATMWRLFEKAGESGWMSIIPILNTLILIKIAGKEWWWIILFAIPIVNIIVAFMLVMGLAENFGKDTGFAIGLFFLTPIFLAILAWGDAEFEGFTGRKKKYSY
ncbi:MAG: DUF5684 domain-containing protein [Phototrophicaceae bacterium]